MWFEDETFWRDFYEVLFPAESFDGAARSISGVLDRVAPGGGALLDLCCGPGRYTVPLAARGFSVTGVDRSEFLLDIARSRMDGAGSVAEFVVGDMRAFSRPRAFDVVTILGNSLGYFATRDEDRLVLEKTFDNLRPGGRVVLDMACRESLARSIRDFVSDHPGGTLCVRRHHTTDNWTRQVNQWLLVRGDSVTRFEFTLQVYSGFEVRQMLLDAGFTDVSLHGDFDGRPFEGAVNRLVATARKPQAA